MIVGMDHPQTVGITPIDLRGYVAAGSLGEGNRADGHAGLDPEVRLPSPGCSQIQRLVMP